MRIRSTKPEFWRSERIASVNWDARLVLKGLESYVDDNGVGVDDIALIVTADEARVVIEAELDPANAGTWGLGARAYTPTEQAAAARRAADAWKDTRPDE
jgi:hypothetical protein